MPAPIFCSPAGQMSSFDVCTGRVRQQHFMRRWITVVQTGVPTPPASATPNPTMPSALMWGVKIPMRDGIALNATIMRPQNAPPLP